MGAFDNFAAPLAPRFCQVRGFDKGTTASVWHVVYMRLDGGVFRWASKGGITGTIDEVRASWPSSIMTPADRDQSFRVEEHSVPPREWDICRDDEVSREWNVLVQKIRRGTVETVEPCVFEYTGTIVELRVQYPRSIFWPKA